MPARHVNYYDYDCSASLTCPHCGWTGKADGHEEHFAELLDITCPECDQMLLIVSYPTADETRAAAEAGNRAAQAELPNLDRAEARWARASTIELRDTSPLPDLDGQRLVIDWDFEETDGETWTVLRHNAVEIWRELAYWEGIPRFEAVFNLLRQRYGSRLDALQPTKSAELYLYGDKLSAPEHVRLLNKGLHPNQ